MIKTSKKSILGYVLLLGSITVLVSTIIPPSHFWPAYFLSLLILPVIGVNILLFTYYLLRTRWLKFILTSVFLLFCYPFVLSTYVVNSADDEELDSYKFKVLSYNASFFNVGPIFTKSYYSPDLQQRGILLKDWLSKNDADIKCIQEFYNDENSDIFNSIEAITKRGGYDYFFLSKPAHKNGVKRGMVIFSKFPIVNSGELFMSNNLYNASAYADVVVHSDTIRIINTHLQSMNLKEGSASAIRDKLSRIKHGAIRREDQLSLITEFINSSPYEVVLCGDFNEIPYTYSYLYIKDRIDNSFEEAGNGFGFTYNGRSLFFLRIDHQFHTKNLKPTKFITYSDNYLSAHFPIECEYKLLNKEQLLRAKN
ncbi:endonuclease/exonuclease/phosphatase family protein (plasmid) [Flammeovirgaceae bacterium SG7u.111]|nr:endonuclease/exonuclease/phosphatase family protein [Flammeovirgaceae bacterium SG7u.132]WPO38838.1 endonuclease/exonuclease/phosphatase family protein [Flammeovirgaceae bacterium SG7u.111]